MIINPSQDFFKVALVSGELGERLRFEFGISSTTGIVKKEVRLGYQVCHELQVAVISGIISHVFGRLVADTPNSLNLVFMVINFVKYVQMDKDISAARLDKTFRWNTADGCLEDLSRGNP